MKTTYYLHGTYNSGRMERIVIHKANYLAGRVHDVSIITVEQKGRVSFFEISPNVTCLDLGINYADDNERFFMNGVIIFTQRIKKNTNLTKFEPNNITIFLLKIKNKLVIIFLTNS